MVQQIRVLIADNQSRARQGMRALLATLPNVPQVKEAANGRQAVTLVEEFHPDVVLMDVRMPELDGVEATRQIKARFPQVKIIALSMFSDYRDAVLQAGADAFVSKGDPPEELLAALESIIRPAS